MPTLSTLERGTSCVIGIDAKRRYVSDPKDTPDKTVIATEKGYCWFDCSIYGGREFTGIDALKWASECQERGAGEILLTSMFSDTSLYIVIVKISTTSSELFQQLFKISYY